MSADVLRERWKGDDERKARVRRLIDDSTLRHQMGRQLNQWVSDNFYLSKNTDKWFSAIFD